MQTQRLRIAIQKKVVLAKRAKLYLKMRREIQRDG